jgi:hypothetical protein
MPGQHGRRRNAGRTPETSTCGSLEPIYNAVSVAEQAVEKGAETLLI